MRERNRQRLTRHIIVALAGLFVLALATGSAAQVGIFPTPKPTQQPTSEPTFTPPPATTPTPTPRPVPSDVPIPTESVKPGESPVGETPDAPTPGPGDEKFDKLPPGLAPQTYDIPVIARTRARNTSQLVGLLEPLTEYGIPLEEVLVEGMGRFPVAGYAYYRDDWLNPRFTPVFHLHRGLDIWAEFGTPIRSPDRGYISRISDAYPGGISIYVRGTDGTTYFFTHMQSRAEGMRVGLPVDIGTVIGFVGNTGNAENGPPHLHFEIRRPDRIPPKPSVDKWLDEAIALAPQWVEARREEIQSKRGLLGGEGGGSKHARGDLEASMLLTLLDPVGGSVGLLPRLELAPTHGPSVSSTLLLELIRLRLDGYLFAPSSSQGLNPAS